ncbi:MAG: hypothetical protein EOP48_34790 [Sphingobacteriales bacterium]|nr:MAG: hypothetical protein EOP48_34790 [Sphingobacteriales bacterium]
MTHKIKLGALALVLSSSLLMACSDDDDPISQDNTIAGKVISSADFSTLEDAMNKANLQTTLRGTGPFTVFAPDNAAFAASGITPAVLNSLTSDQAATILLYHTLAAEVMAANVPAGPNAKVITASGDSIYVTRNASGVYVNGIPVTQADIDATNGVIHKISRVLLPPAGNLNIWTGPGDSDASFANAYDYAHEVFMNNFRYEQTLWQENGSYFKINQVTLSYNVEKKLAKRIGLNGIPPLVSY